MWVIACQKLRAAFLVAVVRAGAVSGPWTGKPSYAAACTSKNSTCPHVWQVPSTSIVARFTVQVDALPHCRHGVLKSMGSECAEIYPMGLASRLACGSGFNSRLNHGFMPATSGAVQSGSTYACVGRAVMAFGLVNGIRQRSFPNCALAAPPVVVRR